MAIKKGDKIKVEYTGSFDDGTVFDSSEKHGKPLEFEAGAGKVIKGFDNAVIGMEKGEEKEVKIEPSEGYGDSNPELIKEIPKENLPKGDIKPGTILGVNLPNGAQLPAKVVKVDDKTVSLDLNHPMAGKVLNFKIKVVDIL